VSKRRHRATSKVRQGARFRRVQGTDRAARADVSNDTSSRWRPRWRR